MTTAPFTMSMLWRSSATTTNSLRCGLGTFRAEEELCGHLYLKWLSSRGSVHATPARLRRIRPTIGRPVSGRSALLLDTPTTARFSLQLLRFLTVAIVIGLVTGV